MNVSSHKYSVTSLSQNSHLFFYYTPSPEIQIHLKKKEKNFLSSDVQGLFVFTCSFVIPANFSTIINVNTLYNI